MRPYRTRSFAILVVLAPGLLLVAGCSHKGPAGYQGYVEGGFVYVASPESGRLDHLSVARGDTIAVGHPLFAFDREPEVSEERQAEQLLHSSESRLVDLRVGKRPQEVEVTRAQLTQAQAQKEQADAILSSDEAQFSAGGIPKTELIAAQAAARTSAAKVREIEAELAVDALPAREQQIRAQGNQVAADRAALASAEWKLQQKEMTSPRQGLVFDTLYRVGEWVAAGSPVVQLLPSENMEIRFFVPETMVGRLHVGDKISAQCDGCAAVIPAAITYVSPQSEYTPPVIYSNENRAKLVFLVIAKPPVEKATMLHPGQPVEVTFQ